VNYTKRFEEIGKDDVALAGGKGANLGELNRAGLPVPAGFVLTTTAYDAFVESNGIGSEIVRLATGTRADGPTAFEEDADKIRALFFGGKVPEKMVEEIRASYEKSNEDGEMAVAVRSSATAEDLAGASFAGQQETFLNVRGAEALMEAVKDCWASLWTARAMAYRVRQDIDPATVSLAVVVQSMVEAEAAGVIFTANPANGHRNEAAIGAAWGLGESVVSGAVTTDDIVVEKSSGRVISRETANKEVMTVYTEIGTDERPVPEARRRQPVLDDETAAKLARYGARIEDHYGTPQDIEWALSNGELFVLQARPITALPEPIADPPTDWSVPRTDGMYARASIVEQMPDPLSPLFADLADGSVARSLRKLVSELFGSGTLRDGDIGLPTINGYAYYYLKTAALLRLGIKTPSVALALYGRGKGSGTQRWREYSHPLYARKVEEWEARSVEDLPAAGLLAGVRELLEAGAEYYTSVQTIIPLAAYSEATLTAFYDRLVRREEDPPAQTFLLGFDSTPIRAEKSLYDLAMWTREQPGLAKVLKETPSESVLDLLNTGGPPSGVEERLWQDWQFCFQDHLDRYGRTVYNLDFVNPVPADDPAPLFDTLKFYLRGEGQNPHERQRRISDRREEATRTVQERLDAPRRILFGRFLKWTQDVVPVREDALADVGLAWPAMRRMLLELGHRLEKTGAIEKPADVFWLHADELEDMASALDIGETRLPSLADAVEERKAIWRGQRRVTPPQLLPKGTWFTAMEGLMPAASEEQTGGTIKGVAASTGRVTAPARVLGGPEDFGQMRPGEVLVAGITTPAWTPLFAMASAVVTDVGGPLSHSSIVAREYGIPAVLGTAVATRRIQSGQSIRVDGDAGTVTLLDGAGEATAERPVDGEAAAGAPSNSRRRMVGFSLAAGAAIGAAAWWRKRRRG
jgi:phosphohistidine swiveling domain-containing protein